MSTPTTNYFVLSPYSGLYNDLGRLFRQRGTTDPSANLTGFQYLDPSSNKQTDINNLFYPLTTGKPQLSYKTNMSALGGKDLNSVFQANTFIVNGSYTVYYDTSNNYYTIAFANYLSIDPSGVVIGNDSSTATLQFLTNVKGVIFTAVAGGGGGGCSFQYVGGGGGAGGDSAQQNIGTANLSTPYIITVGAGGQGSNTIYASGSQGGQSSVSSSDVTIISSTGGNGGGSSTFNPTAAGVGGAGGTNGKSGGDAGYPANDGGSQTTAIAGYTGGTAYYYGGGGGGGTNWNSAGFYSQVLGGLGGGGAGLTPGSLGRGFANKGLAYTGVNGISYLALTASLPGLAATGGGGTGGNALINGQNSPGSQGGSGIVLCCFQLA